MKFLRVLYLITSFTLFSLVGSAFNNQDTPANPAYLIDSQSVKYLMSQGTITKYSCNGTVITTLNRQPVYSCPASFKILDYDLIDTGQTLVVGIIIGNQKHTFLEIFDPQRHERLLIKDMTSYRPWKLRFADIDQDSNPELCLGVLKASPLHPVITKRLFIYNFQHGLQPKWLGSRLAHPFTDFELIVAGNKTILAALELTEERQPVLSTYKWESFGFNSIPAPFDSPLINASNLKAGYSLKNNIYQRVIFVLNQNTIINIVETDWGTKA